MHFAGQPGLAAGRRRRAAGVAAVVAVVALVATAPPAAAHAELVASDPGRGARLTAPPEQIVLEFTEPVEASIGGIRVYDTDGERVDAGRVFHPGGRPETVATPLPDLPPGAYVVTWRVVSADSHPVKGAFTFRIGAATGEDTAALAERLLAAQGESTAVGAVHATLRTLVFAGLLTLVGSAFFVGVLWPAGAPRRLPSRIVAGAWLVTAVATAALIPVQGAYGAGLGLEGIADVDLTTATLETRFGRASLARLVLLAATAPLMLLGRRRLRASVPAGGLLAGSLAVAAAGLLATPGLAGHATTGDWVGAALVSDTVHLAAAALWLGGLVVLAAGLLRHGEPEAIGDVVPRFSRLAFGCVAVLVATGSFQSWRQVGSIDALTTTTYGRLLLVKVGLVAAMVAAASMSRRWVRGRFARPGLSSGPGAAARSDVRHIRRSVAAETAVAAAVVVVTALLVNAIPARTAVALPYTTSVDVGTDLTVDVTVDPAKADPVDLHLYTLTPAGLPAEVDDLEASLALPERDIGPLDVGVERAGGNHFVAYGLDVPIAGRWELTLRARRGDFVSSRATVEIPVR